MTTGLQPCYGGLRVKQLETTRSKQNSAEGFSRNILTHRLIKQIEQPSSYLYLQPK